MKPLWAYVVSCSGIHSSTCYLLAAHSELLTWPLQPQAMLQKLKSTLDRLPTTKQARKFRKKEVWDIHPHFTVRVAICQCLSFQHPPGQPSLAACNLGPLVRGYAEWPRQRALSGIWVSRERMPGWKTTAADSSWCESGKDHPSVPRYLEP